MTATPTDIHPKTWEKAGRKKQQENSTLVPRRKTGKELELLRGEGGLGS